MILDGKKKKGFANRVMCKQRLQVGISSTFGPLSQEGNGVNMSHLNISREMPTYSHSFILEYFCQWFHYAS